MGNAQYMADHLKEFGWEYVVCDIQWSEPNAGKESPYYVPFAWLTMDEYGRLSSPPRRALPLRRGGARASAPSPRRSTSLGLKFGIHIMRGVPRQAVHQHLPVLGTDTTCDKIAAATSLCRWNTDMYGIDPSEARGPGLLRLHLPALRLLGRGLRQGGRHLQHQRLPRRPLLRREGDRAHPQGHRQVRPRPWSSPCPPDRR